MLDWLVYAGVVSLSAVARLLPLRAALAVGSALGRCAYYVVPIRRRVVFENLEHVFGDSRPKHELRRIARASYRHFGMTLVETLRFAFQDPSRFELHTRLIGIERLREVRDAKEGIIFCVAHAGNFELLGYATAYLGFPMKIMTRAIRNARLDASLGVMRGKYQITPVYKGAQGFRTLVKHMKQGGTCAILPDQNAKSHGVVVPFLGKPASTFQAPALLHLVTGARLVVAVDVRLDGDPLKHECELVFVPPWSQTPDRDRDVEGLTRRLNELMGEAVLRHPEQYLWVHRRWGRLDRSAPGGAPLTESLPTARP